MIYRQSRLRNILNRLYEEVLRLAAGALILACAAAIWELENLNLHVIVVAGLTSSLAISLWLFAFNRFDGKVTEYAFHLNEEGFSFIRYGVTQAITWEDLAGLSVSGRLPKYIVVHSKVGRPIRFSYYMFSASQRQVLFQVTQQRLSNRYAE